MSDASANDPKEFLDVAIVGMSGRFPGAEDLNQFWLNLRNGVESITTFTEQEMEALGVDRELLRKPNFVRAGALLKDIDKFDASFFGYSPREAEVLDPQQRVLLECAWDAFENAGYNPEAHEGLVGVFAGTSMSTYLLYNILSHDAEGEDGFQLMIANDKDFLSTRVSYELGLKGPSIDVQSACSTSLVAVHLACQSLLGYQCDMALAGGVSIQVPQRTGYFYQPGGINSPDGHCRAYDAAGQGTVFGSGVGLVVLKRLEDALADGDHIHAVIRGSAINNDGSLKVGYTAPSVEGQAQVISMALMMAGLSADEIGYVEGHGTGTALGDPVEVRALTKAFRTSTQRTGFCALGSVKTNVGHLDAAAGVAGLIKATLALARGELPPTLHFQSPNPQIDFSSSPFYVNSELRPWERPEGGRRRAGVSSFGVGGTNAHLILEEAPDEPPRPREEEPSWEVLPVSARTPQALADACRRLGEHLRGEGAGRRLSDVAHTLQVGRRGFAQRAVVVCRTTDEAAAALTSLDTQRVHTGYPEPGEKSVVFMFPGGGAQYVNMAAGLYESEPTFRQELDRCLDLLRPQLSYDLREYLFPDQERAPRAAEQMKRTSIGLPALFVVEYALARLWQSRGVHPEAMIGHSLGEYVAGCLAGVFSLEDALRLVVLRGRLFEQLPPGEMLSVPLSEQELRGLLNGRLSMAAVNGPSQCVVSGPLDASAELQRTLAERGVEFRRLQIDVAAHCQMVDSILPEFTALLQRLHLNAPAIPFISNVTGTWITPQEATSPGYWARHLRQTVCFGQGVAELLREPQRVLLEVGPGQTLSTLVNLQAQNTRHRRALSCVRHPYEPMSDEEFMAVAVGKLWLAGVEVDWRKLYGASRRRTPLPTYPFERQSYWIKPAKQGGRSKRAGRKQAEVEDWVYLPVWKQSPPALRPAQARDESQSPWLIFADKFGLAAGLIEQLRSTGREVITVVPGSRFAETSVGTYTLDPARAEDYAELVKSLAARAAMPGRIVHAWSVAFPDPASSDDELFDEAQAGGFYSLLYLAQALAGCSNVEALHLDVLSNNVHDVTGEERRQPAQSTLMAACLVIQQENPNLRCRSIDVGAADAEGLSGVHVRRQLVEELTAGGDDLFVAYRGRHRWVQDFEPLTAVRDEAAPSGLREGGVYLITGGLGGVGGVLAEHLAREARARLVLVGRTELPGRESWESWLSSHDEHDATSVKLRLVRRLEALGAQVMLAAADVADVSRMEGVVAQAEAQFGPLVGVIHAAGAAGEEAIRAIPQLDRGECERQFHPKVRGLHALAEILRGKELDFCMLVSSVSSVLGGIGHAAYAAANIYLDAFARQQNRGSDVWLSIAWDVWQLTAEKEQTFSYKGNTAFGASVSGLALSPEEGSKVFGYLLARGVRTQALISTGDLQTRINQWVKLDFLRDTQGATPESEMHARPTLEVSYVAPDSVTEKTVARVWQEVLGIGQVGLHDNFFELGGNSLLGLKVVARLKKECGIDVPVVALFEGPTVLALSKLLTAGAGAEESYERSRSRGARRLERRQRTLELTRSE